MKRLYIACLAVCCTLALFVKSADAAETLQTKVIKLNEAAPVFQESVKAAVFQKGTSLTVFDQDNRFYFTKIGTDTVKFSKQKGKEVNQAPDQLKGAHPVRLQSKKQATIYEQPKNRSTKLGHIQPKTVFFAQRIRGDYYPIIFGGKTGFIHKNDVAVQKGIPVIMYHDLVVSKDGNNPSQLEVAKFEEQMTYLRKNKWTTITPEQLTEWIKKRRKLPEKSVLITFDDGYASTVDYAYPILKKNQFRATSFLIANRINRPGTVSEQDIVNTQDVFSYGNHTFNLHGFNSKTGLALLEYTPRLAVFQDTVQANQRIESILSKKKPVTAFAYPYGISSTEAIRAIKVAGIQSAYTIAEGNVFQGDSIYQLRRQRVHSEMTIKDFAAKLNGQ